MSKLIPETSSTVPIALLPKAVLFDHDGVLVASESLHWMAWHQLLDELAIPYRESELRALVGMPAPLILKNLLDHYRPGWKAAQYDLDALALRKNDFFGELAQTRLQAYPGVKEGLQWLQSEKILCAVVSNAKGRELFSGLDRLGLASYFQIILSRDELPIPKPHPSAYLLGATKLGVKPEHCIAVEDSPTGIESALLGQIPAAAVLTNFSHEIMSRPVKTHPHLQPTWIGESIIHFFDWMKSLPHSN
ncbi:MAG: HAD-IA family hydrolase [Methylotenera sp.]|nr:HAD-IA family hydrolase [Oligoflexia bacterium]